MFNVIDDYCIFRLECGTSNYTSITLLKFGFNDIQRHGKFKLC